MPQEIIHNRCQTYRIKEEELLQLVLLVQMVVKQPLSTESALGQPKLGTMMGLFRK